MNEVINYPGWKVVSVLGAGSFGKVYEIERTEKYGDTDNCALKQITIPPSNLDVQTYYDEMGLDEASLSAMLKKQMENITNEFSVMSRLKGNSYIVSYEDHSVIPHDDGIGWDIYIRMELLTPLTAFLRDNYGNGPVDDETVIRIGSDLCRGLELCEKNAIIHRDIKPQNIFVSKEGNFKLGDFGIAKNSDHATIGTKTGTFSYMAPEVYAGRPYGNTVDIYSLGMVLYWLLNERRGPFLPLPPELPTAEAATEALTRRLQGEPVPAPRYGSPALQAIVLRACSFDPAMRYQHASEMLSALQSLTEPAVQRAEPLKIHDGNLKRYARDVQGYTGPLEMTDETVTITAPKPPAKKKKRWLIPVIILGSLFILISSIISAVIISNAIRNRKSQAEYEARMEAQKKNLPKEVLRGEWIASSLYSSTYTTQKIDGTDYEVNILPYAMTADPENPDTLILGFKDRFEEEYRFYASYKVENGVLSITVPFGECSLKEVSPLTNGMKYEIEYSGGDLVLRETEERQSAWYENYVAKEHALIELEGAASDPDHLYSNYLSFDLTGSKTEIKERACKVYWSDGGYPIDPVATVYSSGSVSISWKKQMILYNGRLQEEQKSGYESFTVINTSPNGFIIRDGAEYYLYQKPLDEPAE